MYKAGSLRAGLPSLILIDMATIFSKIITGEIPSYKVAENEDFYAFWISIRWQKDIHW